MDLPSQTITTKDGLQVVAKCIIKYEISDIKEFMLKIYDAKDAVSDTSQGIVRRSIAALTWSQCYDSELENTITKKTRAELKKWGISIDTVTFTNLGLVRSLRLFNEKDPDHRFM
jgi:regulator of protease activity HflC (stomatin/prohibitin superfamily)